MSVDWVALRTAATEVMRRAYAPYSSFPVGAAALVDDGRVVAGCNVENASYGVGLCAECGVVSALHASGGGRLIALSCVDGAGTPLMPCGRCRQLLWEHGGPQCLVDAQDGPLRLADLLPHAFGADDLDRSQGQEPPVDSAGKLAAELADSAGKLAAELADSARKLAELHGRGTVFVHPDSAGGQRVWTAYWERSVGFFREPSDGERGILEEGPNWPAATDGVAWGRERTSRVVVVDADGGLAWAGEGDPPAEIGVRWAEGVP